MRKSYIYQKLREIKEYNKKNIKLLFSEHHLSHAASTFYSSNYEKAAILTVDGVGEWATASIGFGKGKNITVLKELHFPHSLGLLYSAFTYYLGFKVNSGEYKLMGLAPYGNKNAEQTKEFVSKIKDTLCYIYPDGSIWLNQSYFDYATGLKMIKEHKWKTLFGLPKRKPESSISQVHCNLALAIQQVTEEIVLLMVREVKRLTGAENICMAGGVALNCVANGKIQQKNIFKNIFIQPAAGDAGGALGAAQAAHYIYFENERKITHTLDQMKGSYLGPQFSALDIERMSKRYKAVYEKYSSFDGLSKQTASLLADGNVIGWFQGRMEFGPRALGARSILADARNPNMQKKLNLKIKYREGFRPFAPSILIEKIEDYFDEKINSPYMLFVQEIKSSRRNSPPQNYNSLPLMERLYFLRSDIPAVTHVDYSARIQTVHKETNPKYWKLINDFEKQTGYALLINTSFNVRGEPIVCTPTDAYKCFMCTEMDCLVMENFIFYKKNQPKWIEESNE